MITKSEWRSINESLNSEERARLEPPAFDEVLQYMRGELPAEDEERMRERLVPFPELVRALTAQFPTEGAKPGDPDYVSDDEFAKQWAFLKHRAKRKSASQFWPAIVFGGLFWRAQTQLQIERTMPRVASDEQPLVPDGQRGGGEEHARLTAQGDSILLDARIVPSSFDDYRLTIIDATNADHALWSTPVLHRASNESFAILVPRAFLKNSSKVQVVLYGVSGAREEKLATYTLLVP